MGGIFQGANGGRQDKSAAVWSVHVVVFLMFFRQPAYSARRRQDQKGKQIQTFERRRCDRAEVP